MSDKIKYKVKETPIAHQGTRFDAGSEVELTDEEASNIGLEYLEKVEESSEQTPPADEGAGESGEGASNETDNPPAEPEGQPEGEEGGEKQE